MFYNVYEIQQLAQLRKEETERNTRYAWKSADFERETLLQKMVNRWNSRKKSKTLGCACQCG